MKIQRYLPLIGVLTLLVVLAGTQGLLRQDLDSSELYESQVGDVGTSLEDVSIFELEVELFDDKKVKMHYMAGEQEPPRSSVRRSDMTDNSGEISGEQAIKEIEMLINSLPSLATNEPLTLIQAVLDQLEIHQTDVSDFELDYELKDGTFHQIELEIDDERDE